MKNKKSISLVISLLLAVGLMYLVLRQIGLENIPAYFHRINYGWIFLTFILYMADGMLRAYRWREILKDNQIEIGLMNAFFAYNLGNSLNIIVPAKIGDLARSYYLKSKYGYFYSKTLPATFMDRVFDVIGVYILIMFCSIYVLAKVKMEAWFYDMMVLGVILLILVFVMLEFGKRNRQKLTFIKNEKIHRLIDSLFEVFDGSIKNRKKLLWLTVCSTVIWLSEGLFTYIVFLSIKETVNPVVAIFANMIAVLTKVFPITPGGIGVFEGTMVLVFALFGLNAKITGVVSVINHFLMNLYTIAVGVLTLLKDNISISKIKMEKVD
jgi:hypothetical protein